MSGRRGATPGAVVIVAAALVGGGVGGALAVQGGGPGPAPRSGAGPSPRTAATAPATSPPRSRPSPAAPGVREGFAPSLALGPTAVAPVPVAPPVAVALPSIGVDSPLVALGISADGSLQVPGRDQFDEAGWLTTQPAPGAAGAAVIAGHVDSKAGPAVFYRLRELRPGDPVDVRRADGSTVTFTVDTVQQVGKDAFPTAAVYGPQPGPELRLITCGGPFDRATGHYADNVIAFASLR